MLADETAPLWRELAFVAKSLGRALQQRRDAVDADARVAGKACGIWISRNQHRALEAMGAVLEERLQLVECDNGPPVGPLPASWILRSVAAGARYARSTPTRRAIDRLRLFRVAANASLLLDSWTMWLSKRRPTVVVLSNDHMVACRAIAHAAQNSGVPVVYVQHASVTDWFPSLRCFDAAFLDGERAEAIYRAKGDAEAVTIIRTGAIRNVALHAARRERRTRTHRIGVAINKLGEPQRLSALLRMLGSRSFEAQIVIRPHPGQQIDLAPHGGGDFLLDESRTVDDFMRSIDVLICGSTSTPMEAVAAGVPCFYYQLEGDAMRDYYGYVASGVIPELGDISEVHAALDEPGRWALSQCERFGVFDEGCLCGPDEMIRRVRHAFAALSSRTYTRPTRRNA